MSHPRHRFTMRIFSTFSVALATCLVLPALRAQAEDAAADTGNAPPLKDLIAVTTIEPGRYKIGAIEIDAKTREIVFPATVNMREGLIEFPITHVKGRVHEAIFTTEVLPIQIQTALLLANYEMSGEAFPLPLEKEVPLGEPLPPMKFPPTNPESHVAVSISWKDKEGEDHTARLESILGFGDLQNPETPVDYADQSSYWIFTGSNEEMGAQVFDLGGAMVGTRLDKGCILNPEPNQVILENVWLAKTDAIPEIGTSVKVHFEPASIKTKKQNP